MKRIDQTIVNMRNYVVNETKKKKFEIGDLVEIIHGPNKKCLGIVLLFDNRQILPITVLVLKSREDCTRYNEVELKLL